MDRNAQRRNGKSETLGNHVASVVVGIDGTETSWDAFWWACGEARRLSGRTVAAYVGSTSAAASAACVGGAMIYGAIEQVVTDQADHLGDQVRQYASDHGIDITFVHTHGDIADGLLRIAEVEHADLIVVGRSTKARHHLAGSLGRRLVGKRNSPIIVVVP